MLEFKGVTKTFNPGTVDAKTALDNLSFKVNKEDFITIIGANGAGKFVSGPDARKRTRYDR